jgi:hypothetical protein
MDGCLESRCVGRVYGADGAVRRTAPSIHQEYINKITLLHQVGIPNYFMRKKHVQTTLKFPYEILQVLT